MSYFLFILGIICLFYCLKIRALHSGNGFYLVWGAIGFFFLILGLSFIFPYAFFRSSFYKAMTGLLLLTGLLLILIPIILIAGHFRDTTDKDLDAIIVLGAQLKETGPSRVLRTRLITAARYLKQHPQTLCIVSGAKGPNEPGTEAEGMADYLMAEGIPADRIILEKEARNTAGNIRYSLKYINFIDKDPAIGIVTNNFHMYRALRIARKSGIKRVYGMSAPSMPAYLPNNCLRESLAIWKEFLTSIIHFRNI